MLDPKKNYTEFTPPLEEFPPLEDKPSAIDAPEFAPPEPEFPFVEDKPARITAPEITEPGRFQWFKTHPEEKKKTFQLGAQMLSAVMVLALALGLFRGVPASADVQPVPDVTVEESSEEPVEESKEDQEPAESSEPMEESSVIEESQPVEESSQTKESSEPTPEVSGPQITATLTSAGSSPWGESSITATFVFEPEDDSREYYIYVAGLGLKWYDASLNMIDFKDKVYEGDILSMIETNYDPEYGIPWTFTYEGGAHTDYQPEGAAFYSVTAVLVDSLSEEVFQAETNMLPAPTITETAEPECEIYAWSYYSEVDGYVTFAHMENASLVEINIYDTLTGSLEVTEDITDYAVNGDNYTLPVIDVWGNHPDEYMAESMATGNTVVTIQIDVTAHFPLPDGEKTETWSATSVNETDTGYVYFLKYIAESESDSWPEAAGKFFLEIMPPGAEPATVIFDPAFPEDQLTTGMYKITAFYHGGDYDLAAASTMSTVNATTYNAEGKETPITILDVIIDKPADLKEDSGFEMYFTISWYSESYGKVLTVEKHIAPESYH
ncbi:MAG: hypothetical protein IKG51_07015 [Firmicutes bacterium]|nr:hypothetical protein [Bacillota bacterium]